MKLSIIIPVYNEEKTIGEVIRRVGSIEIPAVTKEIIVVDDGSTDATMSELSTINYKLSTIKIIKHRKNMGKGAAVRTGIDHATGDYIIIQDADLEYNPKYIKELVKPIMRGETEVVYGTRLKRLPHLSGEESKLRFLLHYFGNRLLSLVTSIFYGQWLTDMETGYKLFPKRAIARELTARGFDFEPEITSKLLKKGYRILEVPIKTTPRSYKEGKKLRTVRDGSKALWTLIHEKYFA